MNPEESISEWRKRVLPAYRPLSKTARQDLNVLLTEVLNRDKSWILAHEEALLSENELSELNTKIEELYNGVPLPYVLGKWYFFGLEFRVSPDVLIPRPETELMVEIALEWAEGRDSLRIVDVGTGSGCIGISICKNLPNHTCFGVDISLSALRTAKQNIHLHNVGSKMFLLQGNLLSSTTGPFDLICANLPYIPERFLDSMEVSRFEPMLALDGGKSGLKYIQELLHDACSKIKKGGLILLEFDERVANEVQLLAQTVIPSGKREIVLDLAGKPRILKISV